MAEASELTRWEYAVGVLALPTIEDVGGDVGEGDHDESALAHPGMGNHQIILVDLDVVHPENVDVERAGTPADPPDPSSSPLQGVAEIEECSRLEVSVYFHNEV
jgi:hypothetical protein